MDTSTREPQDHGPSADRLGTIPDAAAAPRPATPAGDVAPAPAGDVAPAPAGDAAPTPDADAAPAPEVEAGVAPVDPATRRVVVVGGGMVAQRFVEERA